MTGEVRRFSSTLLTASLLILVGVVLLFDRLGLVPAYQVFRLWPLLLVALGLHSLYQSPPIYRLPRQTGVKAEIIYRAGGWGARIWGGFLILIGVLFQLSEFGWIRFRFGDLWPMLIILAGVMLIFREIEGRSIPRSPSNTSEMNQLAIFSGFKQHNSSGDFRGGTILAIFGGFELDLRHADIQGTEVVMDATAIMGGGEIRIPETWDLALQGTAIMGGYSDETRHPELNPALPPKRLVVKGVVLFGGIAVKN